MRSKVIHRWSEPLNQILLCTDHSSYIIVEIYGLWNNSPARPLMAVSNARTQGLQVCIGSGFYPRSEVIVYCWNEDMRFLLLIEDAFSLLCIFWACLSEIKSCFSSNDHLLYDCRLWCSNYIHSVFSARERPEVSVSILQIPLSALAYIR